MDYLPRRRHPRLSSAALAGLAALVALAACGDGPTGRSAPQGQPPLPTLSFQGINCGVTFRMIATEDDPLMAQYGIPALADTIDICETWTGSDYDVRIRTAGSSENIPGFVDEVQHTDYMDGNVTGFDGSGTVTADPAGVGSTAFDFVQADATTRQASYDDPYYGVYTGGSGCNDPNGSGCEILTRRQAGPAGAVSSVDTVTRFRRHGLSRRGVRALVEDAEEIAPTGNGHRRFSRVSNGERIVLSVEKETQLLVGEERSGPRGTSRATHHWRKTGKAYVRDRTEIETTEAVRGGREMFSRATLTFQDVRVAKP